MNYVLHLSIQLHIDINQETIRYIIVYHHFGNPSPVSFNSKVKTEHQGPWVNTGLKVLSLLSCGQNNLIFQRKIHYVTVIYKKYKKCHNYFCCPKRCAYTILEGFYYILYIYTVMYSIAQHLTIFMVFCHENKVWYWELFEPQDLASYPLAYPKAGTR